MLIELWWLSTVKSCFELLENQHAWNWSAKLILAASSFSFFPFPSAPEVQLKLDITLEAQIFLSRKIISWKYCVRLKINKVFVMFLYSYFSSTLVLFGFGSCLLLRWLLFAPWELLPCAKEKIKIISVPSCFFITALLREKLLKDVLLNRPEK